MPALFTCWSFFAINDGTAWTKAQKGQSGTRAYMIVGAPRVCPNRKCGGIIFTVSTGEDLIDSFPKERLDFDPTDIPSDLLLTLVEAIDCHTVGAYRAAAMMVRRVLEQLCQDVGANGRDLHSRLEALRSKVILPDELFEAMTELKALGNDAAHVAARNYSDVGEEESELSIVLAKEILKARYQMKSLVERLKQRKSPAPLQKD